MRWLLHPVRLALLFLAALLVYTLVGFFLLPYLIKAYGIPAIAEQLHRPVLIKDVECNPFALSLKLTGFEIREADQSALIGFDEFFINFQAVSLFRRTYVFDTIRLAVPYVSAKVSKEGRLNLADLAPPDETPQERPASQGDQSPAQIPAVEIGQFEITQGIVEFLDQSKPRPYALDIVPIHIQLKNFHTKPGGDNAYAFTAELGKDETLTWEGTVSLEPIRSSGKFVLSGVSLPKLWPYLKDRFRFDITDGMVTADAAYALDLGANPVAARISQASLSVENFAIREEGALDPVIVVPALKVGTIEVDLATRQVTVTNISVENAVWTAWFNPDKTVNYQQLFAQTDTVPTNITSAGSASPAKEETPWSILLSQVTLKNHAIDFEDRSLGTTANIKIAGLTVETHDVQIPLKGPLPIRLAMQVNGTGRIQVEGSVTAKPFQADVTMGLKDIGIRPFQPYLEKVLRLDVLTGAVNLDGTLQLAPEHPKGQLLSYEGNASVTSLAITDRDHGEEVAAMKALSLKTIRLTANPMVLSIGEVGFQEPTAHVIVQADGTMNLAQLVVAESPPESPDRKPVPTKKSQAARPFITVGTVKLLKAAATFRDETVQPPVVTGISDLTGTIKGLSSKEVAKADVDVAGRVDRMASLKIAGTINPLSEDTFTDLGIALANMDLTPEGPYSEKYVGYGLSKGKLFLDLKYKVSQRQLEAENKVVVEQLTFGEKTNSPDATSLPVPFAVALLKDRKGRIEIDLPIRGDLSDPDFKYGKVVFSTLGNLLTKLVASPFSLMGKLVPGSGDGEELQYIEFPPGSAAMVGEEGKKLQLLAKGLEERPGLRLDIAGAADPVLDRTAIRASKLREQLLAMRQRERGHAASMDGELSVEDERRFVTDLYEKQQVPPAGTTTPTPPTGSPKPPTVEEMKQRLVAAVLVEEGELRELARRRAEQVRAHLIEAGKLAEERVYLLEVNLTASGHAKVRSRLMVNAGS